MKFLSITLIVFYATFVHNIFKNVLFKDLFIVDIYLDETVINIRLTLSALIQNELYLIAKQMKKNVEDKTLIIRSIVQSEVINVVNCK